jgi:AbrB family looped-hinge helix DNA binding protein
MGQQARTRVGEKGRVVIPASFREALDIKVGDEVELRIEDNELRLSTLKSRLARAQQRLRRIIKPGRSLSKELIAERREAARLTHEQIIVGMRELRKRVKTDRMSAREIVSEGRPRKAGARPSTSKAKVPVRLGDHPAIGIWANREDMKDPSAWVRKIRAPRYDRLGRRRPKP